MSSGKKGKKSKGITLPLNDFLAGPGGEAPTVLAKPSINWADDVEDEHDGYMSKSMKEPINLPTAPRAARDPGMDEENIPTKPPFNIYLSNLPYEADEEDLSEFFKDLKVANVHLPASKDSNKPKGIGYVEFEDRQSLIDALGMSNTYIKTRRVRIEISNSSNDRGSRMGRDNRRDDRYSDPERTAGDWRSGPREDAPYDGDRYRPRGGFDNRDGRRDDREGGADVDNKPGAWRDGGDRGRSSRDRDDKDKEWARYGSDRGSRDRDGDRDRNRGGSSFGPRRNYGDSDRSDRDWDRWTNRPPAASDSAEPSEPRTRPKLELKPRTIPIEPIVVKAEEGSEKTEEGTEGSDSTPAPTPAPATNIFGEAKPVDTTVREREIEERLTKSYADMKSKEDSESDNRGERRGIREGGAWGRRNGESRDDKDRERRKVEAWRSDDDRGRNIDKSASRSHASASRSDNRGDSRGPPPSRGPPAMSRASRTNESRAPPERERKSEKEDESNRMPKAKDEEAPNFVASNKYSMLPDDVEPDNVDE